MDPPRLRSEAGTLEGRLLRSAPSFEPAPGAQEELWRRVQVATAVGVAAGAAGVATHTAAAAAPEVAGKAIWLTLLKWGAVVAVGVPAAGAATQAVLARMQAKPHQVVEAGPPPVARSAPVTVPSEPASAPPSVPASDAPSIPAHASHPPRHAPPSAAEARSALRAEGVLLTSARTKLATGAYRGALEDVARLGAQFPEGRLVQEREVVAIDALAGLGDRAAMRARSLAFLERYPQSPYAAHVRQLLEP